MTSIDEHERHYIGDLLSEDEVFTQTTRTPPRGDATVGQVPAVSVLAGTAAVGPSPNQAFWPEPPPPYSAATPHWAALHQPGGLYAADLDSAGANSPQFYASPQFAALKAPGDPMRWDSMYTPFGSRPVPPTMTKPMVELELNNATGGFVPVLPSGKSYRDVASNKNSTGSSMNSNVVSPQTTKKKAPASVVGVAHQQRLSSSGDSLEQIGTGKTPAMEQATVIGKQQNHAKGVGGGKKELAATFEIAPPANNEFQKITRKKGRQQQASQQSRPRIDSPSVTATTNDVQFANGMTIAGMGANDVGAQSRFDVLDSAALGAGGGGQRQMPAYASTKFASQTAHASIGMRAAALADDASQDEDDSGDVRKLPSVLVARRKSRRELQTAIAAQAQTESVAPRASATAAKRAAIASGGARRLQRQDSNDAAVIAFRYINAFVMAVIAMVERGGRWIFDLIVDILLQLYDVILYASRATCTNVLNWCQRIRRRSHEKYRSWMNAFRKWNWMFWRRDVNDGQPIEWGLPCNIQLPATGDEAMQRLLRCRGQDAYSILGLRYTCSDDEIKHYYRRQAVLVHPDKNMAQGADEAFKILARAFELIGTKEARGSYNLENIQKDPLHRELEELWERLREKMAEAMNTMHCDCGNKHRRFLTEMRPAEARFCRRCDMRHPARQSDIWAETRFFGLLWYYYACMDGAVYDITQWAACPKNRLKHMKANSHTVQYRLISSTGANATPPPPLASRGGNAGARQNNGGSAAADVDDLLAEYLDGYRGGTVGGGDRLSMPRGGVASSSGGGLEASYRPPERRSVDDSRPRKAGRRRRPPVGK